MGVAFEGVILLENRPSYLRFLAISTGLLLILMIPGLSLVLVIFTLGLGFPFLYILPLAVLLQWLLLPAVFLRKAVWRVGFVLLALVVAALLLAVPQPLADRLAERARDDLEPIASQAFVRAGAIGVEIHRSVAQDPNLQAPDAPIQTTPWPPCFDLCERLLTGGDVAWVRIVLTDDKIGSEPAPSHRLFVARTGRDCAAANADLPASAACILMAPDHAEPADLVFEFEETFLWARQRKPGFAQVYGHRSVTARAGPAPEAEVLFRTVQVFYMRPSGLVRLAPGSLGTGDNGGGIEFVRYRAATLAQDLMGAVTGLGLALGPARVPLPKSPGTESNRFIAPPPDAQDAAYVASLLVVGTGEGAVFSEAYRRLVNDWHDRLRWKDPVSSAERGIFCATLADGRLGKMFWVDQLLRKPALECPTP